MAALVANSPSSAGSRRQSRLETGTSLCAGGILAGPLYLAVSLAQALTRPGFELRRHDVSLLSNGPLGWIQIGNFIVSGVLVIGSAMGLRATMRTGRGRTWGPLLVGLYGLCIALAGVFVADPVDGFPLGTPAATNAISWHGGLHLLCAAVGFLALIAACFVFARRFAAEGRSGWAGYSAATGALFFTLFFGSVFLRGAGAGPGLSVLGLWVAVVLGWTWLCLISAQAMDSSWRRTRSNL